jgi:hypothetical protein
MKNLIDEIQSFISCDALSLEQRISAIAKLCNEETNNYEDLLTIKDYVKADIIADNFDINKPEVAEDEYMRICKLKRVSTYEAI